MEGSLRWANVSMSWAAGSRAGGRTCSATQPPSSSSQASARSGIAAAGIAGANALTLILSVLSITLTQMVLNGQRRSEQAMHLKVDELVYAIEGARNAVAGAEGKSTDELAALRRTEELASNERVSADDGYGG